MKGESAPVRSKPLARGAAIAAQWLMLTIALAAVVVHSESSLEGVITPHIDGSFVFVAAFVAGILMGLTASSVRLLVFLMATMGVAAATIYALLVISPTLTGTMERAEWAENLATLRAFWILLLMVIPAAAGGTVGRLLGDWIEDREGSSREASTEADERPWWEHRQSGGR